MQLVIPLQLDNCAFKLKQCWVVAFSHFLFVTIYCTLADCETRSIWPHSYVYLESSLNTKSSSHLPSRSIAEQKLLCFAASIRFVFNCKSDLVESVRSFASSSFFSIILRKIRSKSALFHHHVTSLMVVMIIQYRLEFVVYKGQHCHKLNFIDCWKWQISIYF